MDMVTDPRLQGVINENRFFEVIKTAIREGRAPAWFYSIRQANAQEDRAGIDGFAKIICSRDRRIIVTVPFQIKSSDHGIIEQLKKNRVFWLDHLRFFVSHPDMKDKFIERTFFEELQKIRKRDERFYRLIEHVGCSR